MTPQERGRLGGKKTFTLYGSEHYSRIGKAGFAALREKYFSGCDAATARFLLSINASKFGLAIKAELKCDCDACKHQSSAGNWIDIYALSMAADLPGF